MSTQRLLPQTEAALSHARDALHVTLRGLATVAGGAKGLDAGLDRNQGAAMRLAQCHAQLFAATEMLAYAKLGPLEADLTNAFAGQTLLMVRDQLATVGLHLEGAPDLAASDDVQAVLRATTSPAFYADVLDSMARQQSDGADSLGEDHKLLRGTFRAFADRKVRPAAERIHRHDELIPDGLIREAAELGCFGLSIPEAYGGVQAKADNVGMVVVTEELCRGALIVGSLITRPEILAKALLKGGTEAQRQKFLPPMVSGEKMVAISVTEPDFGSDVGSISCTAKWDGTAWRLSGTKTWCTFAGRAELIGLLARTGDASQGYKGLSLFVVEKPAFTGHDFEHVQPGGGRMTGRAIGTLGYRGMHSYEVNYEDYGVPAENLVGEDAGRGKGFYLQMEGFAYGRLQTAGRALGVMQAAWEAAQAYARDRKVFGSPLGAYGLTQEKLVRMAATVQACRQATYASARLLDAAEGTPKGQLEASLVKFLACRQAEWLTREAQQIHGGMGYAEEFAVSRFFVDARVLSIFEGAEEVLALRVIMPALLKSAAA